METLRLSNYKCFEDTGIFAFKPINLLVGANSSGKSSFLEFLPLLKQSIGVRKNGSLLWNSSEGIDTQDFLNTVHNGKGDIAFNFSLNSKYVFDKFPKELSSTNVYITISCGVGSRDYIKSLTIICGDKIELTFEGNICTQIKINNRDIKVSNGTIRCDSGKNILPGFELDDKHGMIRGSWFTASYNYVRGLLNKAKVPNGEKSMVLIHNFLRNPLNRDFQYSSLREENMSFDHELFEQIHDLVLYLNIGNVVDRINSYLQNFTDNLIYINPIRQASRRDYSISNVAIDSVSPDGDNMPVYLLNLAQSGLLKEFNGWLTSFFHFTVAVKSTASTVQVLIKEEEKEERNLTDVGYGYSQILPVILAVWDSIFVNRDNEAAKRIRNFPRFVVIEQPEVHLHPRMQGQFATMLCRTISIARERKIDLRVLVETHSETIINKIGLVVAGQDGISKDDVNVVLFNGKHEGMQDEVSYSSFDDNGYLTNWPYGFFDDVD